MRPFKAEADPDSLVGALGARVWSPPAAVDERFQARLKDARRALFAARMCTLAFAAGGAVVASVADAALGGALVVAAAVGFAVASAVLPSGRARGSPLAVFEKGVLVPQSFTNAPGLKRVGGPSAMRFAEVERAELVVEGENRALVLWTKSGTGGIADHRVGAVELKPDEAAPMLESMAAALEGVGLTVKRGERGAGLGPADVQPGPTAAPGGGGASP